MDPHIHLQQGDITKFKVDALVNAANSSLLGGGGVEGAIHCAGRPAILKECRRVCDRQGGCKVGKAVITTGGNLPACYVIHTVGPVWNGGRYNEEQLLANAYRNSLNLAVQNNIKTLAFPNISTGIYHFPKDKAAEIALFTTYEFLKKNPGILEKGIFVCFDQENYQLYRTLLDNS